MIEFLDKKQLIIMLDTYKDGLVKTQHFLKRLDISFFIQELILDLKWLLYLLSF